MFSVCGNVQATYRCQGFKATLPFEMPCSFKYPALAQLAGLCVDDTSARQDGATAFASDLLAERARCKWRNCSFLHSSALAPSSRKNLVLHSTIDAAALLNCKSTSCDYYRKFGVRCVAIQCRSWCEHAPGSRIDPLLYISIREC